MSDNAAPILSRADTVNLISSLRFHDGTDDERAAIHLQLTTTDAALRIEIQRLTAHAAKCEEAYESERLRHVANCRSLVDKDAEIQRLTEDRDAARIERDRMARHWKDRSASAEKLASTIQAMVQRARQCVEYLAVPITNPSGEPFDELSQALQSMPNWAELSALRAELEAEKVDHAGDLTALCFVRSRLIRLRHEACNDELHELSEELTGILSFIDAAISATTAEPEGKSEA